MRLVQILVDGTAQAAVVNSDQQLQRLCKPVTSYELAIEAANTGQTLASLVTSLLSETTLDYQTAIDNKQLLAPITHPKPHHCVIAGTGLTHLGSAEARNKMHDTLAQEENLTDSLRMFKLGVEGGKPTQGDTGVQPEWFYKGNGDSLAAPGADLKSPAWALDGGEEPEVAGIYVIGADNQPYRVGYALGNEFTDHVTEKHNYLWLAHSKLRPSSIGPELYIGELPNHLEGTCRIIRDGETLWQKPFITGEDNMCHSMANLEHHHFKYSQHRSAGDLHIHYFGTSTASFADGIETQAGDIFEVSMPEFGRPLRNTLTIAEEETFTIKAL